MDRDNLEANYFFFVNHFLQSPESHYYILSESNQGVKVNSLQFE